MSELLGDVETPVALVEPSVVRQNARRAVAYCDAHGLAWRPHVKTHKCPIVAGIQLEAGARGLTVATPREAEVMSRITDDILLAYPPVGAARLARLMTLPDAVDLKVALDSPEALDGLAGAARDAGRTVGVLVEVDVGMGRVGLASAEAVGSLAERAEELEGVSFRGILFYPGHLRTPAARMDEGIAQVAGILDDVYATLSDRGLTPGTVSGGSTPTLWRSHDFPHLTEVRAGTWIFNDRDIEALGVAGREDLAYSILATVVSTAVEGQAVVDAGSKALAKEARGGGDGSYGVLLDRPEVPVKGLSEEHGVLDLSRTDWRPSVGDRVRVVPNHVCVSVNLQDHLLALEDGALERWPLDARGRGPVE